MTFSKYWGAAICCLPLYMRFSAVASPRYAKDLLFLMLGVLSLALFGMGSNEKTPLHWLAIASIPLSFFGLQNIASGLTLYQWACFSVGAAVFIQMLSQFKTKDEQVILNAISICCLIQVGLVFLNAFNVDVREWYASIHGVTKHVRSSSGWVPMTNSVVIAGTFDNPNSTAALLGIGGASFFRKGWLYALPMVVLALILCGGVGGILALLAGTFFFFVRPTKLKLLACSTIGTAALIYLPQHFESLSDGGRLTAWAWALQNLDVTGWFMGKGLGHWASTSPGFIVNASRIKFFQLHNEYIEFLYSFGALGVACLFAALFSGFKRARQDRAIVAASAAIACSCAIHFTFHISTTAAIGLAILALLFRGEYAS